MRAEGLKDFGACLSPMNAFHIIQGTETLPLRMERHVQNALKVSAFLDASEEVDWVNHPSVPSHPDHALAKELLPKGAGAILSFGIKGGREGGRKFIESVKLASHLANVGDAKTLVIHPGSTTHQQMSAEALDAAGIGENLIRVSVGIENVDDIIADLKAGLRASQRS
jgi:O-acetylhomoserine (thiol)-lyase